MAPEPSAASFEARVQNRIFLGEHTEYLVRSDALGPVVVLAPRRSEFGARIYEAGERVHINWSGDAALILQRD